MTNSSDSHPTSPLSDNSADVYHQRFSVSWDYPVVFSRNVLSCSNPLLASIFDRLGENRRHQVVVCIDQGLANAQQDICDVVTAYFHAHEERLQLALPPVLIPGGEKSKGNPDSLKALLEQIASAHLDRQSYILAIGGGAMLDVVGLVASLVHRGVRLVRMPSTTLSQNDSGVGVKTGMNAFGQKNYAGTFAPPFAVVNDISLLHTLADRDWLGGVAEAFKVAIIKDKSFFDFLCLNAERLVTRQADTMEELIRRCATIHLDHIRTGGDPFEMGSARPLDFGHWSAHRIEAMTDYEIGHGQAVAVGIALDSCYAMKTGLLTESEFQQIITGLAANGLPTSHPTLRTRTPDGQWEILQGLSQFREHLGGLLTVTLPQGLGDRCEVHAIDETILVECIDCLHRHQVDGNRL